MNKINFSVPRIWLIVGFFLAIELSLLWVYNRSADRERQVVSFCASVVAGSFALYTYLRGLEEKQNEAADRLIERWNLPAMIPLRKPIREITEGLIEPGNLSRSKRGAVLPPEALQMRSDIVAILSFWEEVALAVRTKTANEEKVRRFFEPVMIQGYQSMKLWIDNERTVDNDRSYFVELELVVLKWEALRAKAVQTIR